MHAKITETEGGAIIRPKCPKCKSFMTKLSKITKPYRYGYRWVCTRCGHKSSKTKRKTAYKVIKEVKH